jgi:hypothetical protein
MGCVVMLGLLAAIAFLESVGEKGGPGAVFACLAIGSATVVGVVVLKRRAARLRTESQHRQQLAAAAEEQRLRLAAEAEEQRRQAEYFASLVARFGDAIARQMFAKELWQGATGPMVQEMFGLPADVSTKVYKQTRTEVWKYNPIDARRYALRITFENGVCVGWETT